MKKLSIIVQKFVEEELKNKPAFSIRTYKTGLLRLQNWLTSNRGKDLCDINIQDIKDYYNYLRGQGMSANTVKKTLFVIRRFIRWQNGIVMDENLNQLFLEINAEAKELKALTTLLDKQKIVLLTLTKDNLRDHAIILTVLNTGIRLNELVNLDRADFVQTKQGHYLRIKNKKSERIVLLPDIVIDALENYLKERTDYHHALFISSRHERISERTVQNLLQKFNFKYSDLRNTFIEFLIQERICKKNICQLLGFSSLQQINVYTDRFKK